MRFDQKWMGRNCQKNPEQWFEATVPGNIQHDYAIFHKFEDWNYASNYEQFLPLEDDHWEYRTVLSYDKKEGDRVFFVSGGIDYTYEVLINGKKIYFYEGMYRGFELDLTDHLCGKDDVLTVHIYPHPKSTGGRPNTRDEADACCKPPLSYGWDFNPRLLNSGMWEEAYIETRAVSYIGDCEVLATLSDDLTCGTVNFDFSCALPCTTAIYDADGNEVVSGTDRKVTVQNPNLWWCNGQGTPYLYRWEIRNECESRSGWLGFRTIKLVRNEGAVDPREFPKSRYDAPITIELNGRRIFAKGTNWVAPSLFWGLLDEEIYETHIRMAHDANMNFFRMHAGSGRAKRFFYDMCDRYGILLWQEFPLACNNYRDTPHYMGMLESEATAMILDLRHHPSLALWCGGNELFNGWSGMDEQSHALRLLNKLCYEYDYARPFLYTSPLIGMAHGGYTFWEKAQGGETIGAFQNARHTAYTEFGLPSITDAKLLRKVIPENELFPIRKTKSWITHHGFYAWGEARWLCQDVLEMYFGPANSLEELVAQSDWLQCEGYRAIFEEARRQWPHCSMALNWCLNEPWTTAANNTLIAFPSNPKPSLEYVKNALRPTLFSAKIPCFTWYMNDTFEAELWFLNDTPEATEGTVKVSLTLGEETVTLLEWNAKAEANRNLRGPTVRYALPLLENTDKLTLRLEAENGMASVYTYQYKPKKRRKPVNIRSNNGME